MTKTELVSKVAEKAGLSKKDAEKATASVIDAIVETLSSGDKVQLVGFGTFEVHHRAERIGHNPRTKEEITIQASDYPVFKAGKSFKDAVAK
jgi:DNA-binding protein HU-beta